MVTSRSVPPNSILSQELMVWRETEQKRPKNKTNKSSKMAHLGAFYLTALEHKPVKARID